MIGGFDIQFGAPATYVLPSIKYICELFVVENIFDAIKHRINIRNYSANRKRLIYVMIIYKREHT